MITTICFDFGNVIGLFDHYLALNQLARHTDMSPRAMYNAVINGDLEDAFESGRISSAEFLHQFRSLCHLHCDDETLAAACADIFRPNSEVCTLVPTLKPRYRLLLGSNTNAIHSRQFRHQFADVLRHFDHLVLSHEIGVRKPRLEFFEHCQRLARCAPEACLFIDDLPANIEGARTCGWHGIVYENRGDLRAQLRELGIEI